MMTKKTLSDYRTQNYRLELLDPYTEEKNGGWIELRSGNSKEYKKLIWASQFESQNLSEEEVEAKHSDYEFVKERNADILVTRIADWDEEFFDSPYSPEAVKEVLIDNDFDWLCAQINMAADQETLFFRPKPKKTRKVSKSKSQT